MSTGGDQPQRKAPSPRLLHPQYPDGIPRPLSPKELPAKYKYAERRVRIIIIALPIAVVTSVLLYNRLVKGEGRRVLIHPSPIDRE